jgi:spore maturation protein CgeB
VNPRCIGLKGRDFEVPMTGVAYMTTYNHELAQYFEPGKEIIFYKDSNELINKINYYLEHSKEAVKIGLAGRKRALTDHTWEKRWKQLLEICGG